MNSNPYLRSPGLFSFNTAGVWGIFNLEYYVCIYVYISDNSDDEGDDVHWVSVFSAKAPPKVAESIVLSADKDEEASDMIVAKKKEDRRTDQDKPLTIHVKLEEGATIDVSVFPHFMVGQIMFLLQPKMPPNYGYPWKKMKPYKWMKP